MITKYQLVIIGKESSYEDEITDTFKMRVQDLGLAENSVSIIHNYDFFKSYTPKSPTVCIYFGEGSHYPDIHILKILTRDAAFILPVVSTLNNFSNSVPLPLIRVNGFELSNKAKIEALVGRLLEALSLLRESRRLFISYRRIESSSVAIQLYEFRYSPFFGQKNCFVRIESSE